MANFDLEYKKLIKTEGGYVNDPDDAGGETYKGISRKAHPEWHGWVSIDALKKYHPNDFKKIIDNTPEIQDKVKLFYKTNYWDCFRLDEIPSQGIAHQLLDTAVNCGHSRAIKIAQQVLNMTVTGKWSEELFYNLNKYGTQI